MREKFTKFMVGRYGVDELGRFMNIAILVVLGISLFWTPLSIPAFAVIACHYCRIFSRDFTKRRKENTAFLKLRSKVTAWFTASWDKLCNWRDYRFFKCPTCHQSLRVPRGKGNITLTCPKCNTQFKGKS